MSKILIIGEANIDNDQLVDLLREAEAQQIAVNIEDHRPDLPLIVKDYEIKLPIILPERPKEPWRGGRPR
jgi:hypothetical protein